MLEIDDTSRGVVERLRDSIDYSSRFTQDELAHYLAEIVLAWYTTHPKRYGRRAPAIRALEHAKEVFRAIH